MNSCCRSNTYLPTIRAPAGRTRCRNGLAKDHVAPSASTMTKNGQSRCGTNARQWLRGPPCSNTHSPARPASASSRCRVIRSSVHSIIGSHCRSPEKALSGQSRNVDERLLDARGEVGKRVGRRPLVVDPLPDRGLEAAEAEIEPPPLQAGARQTDGRRIAAPATISGCAFPALSGFSLATTCSPSLPY